MSFISVFDVLGPNMIGPSSSHTAGAARIGFLAQKMIGGSVGYGCKLVVHVKTPFCLTNYG